MFGVCIKTFDDPNLTFQEYLDSRIIEIDIDQLTRILWLCGKPDDEFLSKISSEEVSRQAIFYSVVFFFFFFFNFHAFRDTRWEFSFQCECTLISEPGRLL